MNYRPYIEINPKKLAGKPIIKGTRIAVELVLRLLAQGATAEEIIRTYPHLTRVQIRACLAYATEVIGEQRILPLTGRAAVLA
ncbi:MAG: DUF433 domain-containing protein [Candidatus Vogelbacteria bacterium]|nr:DUF433 domain-containing protein [Candidatus Vogelbacteria bacterium]